MKILYRTSEDMCKQGGGSTHFWEIVDNLQMLGNKLLIVMPGYYPIKKIEESKQKICFVPTFSKSLIAYLVYEFLSIFYLVFYIIKFKPGVVYSRSLFDILPAIITRFFKIPYVIEKNGIIVDELKTRKTSNKLLKLINLSEYLGCKLATRIICVTIGLKKEISRRYNLEEEKIVVVSNGANINLFRPLPKDECRNNLNFNQSTFYVGFIGTFAPWQGLDLLIDAARKVKNVLGSKINFILVGDGELTGILKNKIIETELEDEFIFCGRVDYKNVVQYVNAFDIAVAPFVKTRNEAIGLSPLKLYEYLACGCPVIASKMEGITEIIENGCGYCFDPGDSEQLAEKIIESFNDRKQLKKYGSIGRRIVIDNYSWEIAANKVLNTFYNLSVSGQVYI